MKAQTLLRGLFLASVSTVCWAQDGPHPGSTQRVEITGSYLKQTEDDGIAPVQVITREDIRRSGANSLKELFNSIVNVGYGQSDTGGRGMFSAGSSSAGLRGLGSQSTLVLLNSRRVAPYPLAEYSQIFVNIDALPLEAVQRVEILRTGAAAIYGSEAMAGVINIITRQDYQGLSARASHQRSLYSGTFDTDTASITGGFGDLASDRYNVLVNLEAYHRDGVVWSDVLQYVNPKLTAPFGSFGSFSTYSYPGNIIGAGPIPGCDPKLVKDGLCLYNRYQRFEATPAAERVNLLVSGKLQLQADLLGFAEVLYSKTKTSYLSPYQPYGPKVPTPVLYWGDPSTGQGRTFYYRGLPAGHPLNPTDKDDAELRYRFKDGPNDSSGAAQQYRLLAGLRGLWSGYDWEAATGVMGGSADQRLRGSFSDSGFKQVIGNYAPGQVDPLFFNRDYKIGQPNSPAVIATLFPEYGYRGSTQQVFVDTKLTGEATRYEGRPVNIALGFDLRHERFAVTPSERLRTGDIVGEGFAASSAARNHGAVFGEVSWPITQALELQAAGRIDKFPGLDAHLSPRLGLRFEADPAVLLRGTIETGFRAPNLSESAPSTRYSFEATSDPKRCTQATALAKDLRAAAALLPANDPQRVLLVAQADNVKNAECLASVPRVVENNPGLKPESSRSANLGIVFKPWAELSVAVDYWSILRKNEIGLKNFDTLLAAENVLPAGVINRASLEGDRSFTAAELLNYGVSAGALTSLVGRFENEAKTKTSGIDVDLSGRVGTPAGPLDLRFNGTYLLSLYYWYAARGGYGYNLVGRGGNSRLRGNASATLTTGPFTNALSATYISGTTMAGDYFDTDYTIENCAINQKWTPEQCRYGSRHFVDYYLAYSGIKDLTLSANVQNLFNTRPPINLRSLYSGGGGLIPQDVTDVMGRMLRVTMEYRFK